MSAKVNDNLHLIGFALDFVNRIAREFGVEEIVALKPGPMCCDHDAFTHAVEAAVGIDECGVTWGETDDQDSWLDFWDLNDGEMESIARAVGMKWRRVDTRIASVALPAPIIELGCRLIDGEMPELETV